MVDSELKARAELERLGVRIRLDENGDVLAVSLGKGVVFTDKEMEHLKWMIDLKQLSLNGGNVTDAGLAHLGGLTKLEVLDLCNTKITDAWRDSMPELPGFPGSICAAPKSPTRACANAQRAESQKPVFERAEDHQRRPRADRQNTDVGKPEFAAMSRYFQFRPVVPARAV